MTQRRDSEGRFASDDGSKYTINTARQELSKLHTDVENYEQQLNAMETRLRN